MMKDDAGGDIDVERIDAFSHRHGDTRIDHFVKPFPNTGAFIADEPHNLWRQRLFLQRHASLIGSADSRPALAQLDEVSE